MKETNQNPLSKTIRILVVLLLKAFAMVIALAFRLFSLICSKVSEIIEKYIGNDKNH
ncbi:hypothetical protein [Flavipsychrobacter stenotrophus]|uniref:hypothetical protein n=1 Tax=Flavipsychrobacter stenotrophus TaxID=2077091 RepID=UPI0013753915|nr:hypothetical protein [Flavipsychrobacter stenotrophus]